MTADHTAPLAAATRRRSEQTRTRAREALRRLDRRGATITYAAVAKAAGVSRALLYRDPDLRETINKLRNHSATTIAARQPAAQRMSLASREELLATLREDIKTLRAENRALRARLATILGDERTSP